MHCTVPGDDPGLNSGNVTILYDVQEMSFNIVSLRNLPNSIQNTPNSAYMDFGYMVFLSDFSIIRTMSLINSIVSLAHYIMD